MKKLSQFSLILVSALVLSACGLPQNSTTSQKSDSAPSTPKEFSLKDLIAQNISQKCSWSAEDNGSKVTAEIIISGKKFKQTVVSQNEQGENVINAINDGQYVYIWDNKSKENRFAMKMKSEDTQAQANDSNEKFGQINLDEKHKLSCAPTVVSDSDFNPPSDIKFTDYNQFLDQIKSSIPNITVPVVKDSE